MISPGLKRLAFTIPVSMTYLIPEMVTDVSAMLVDRMTFLQPWKKHGNVKLLEAASYKCGFSDCFLMLALGAGWNTLSCCAGGREAYRGRTTMEPQPSGTCLEMSRHVLARASISSCPVMNTKMS